MTIIIQAPNGVSLHQFCLGLIMRLRQAGHRVVAVGRGDNHFSLLKSQGIALYDLALAEDAVAPHKLYRYIKRLWEIYRAVRPDMIHLFSPRAALFGTVAARALNIPVICSLTGLGNAFTLAAYHPLRLLFIMLYRLILPLTKAVIFLNPDDQSYFRKLRLITGRRSLLIRSSGVNIQRYHRGSHAYPATITFTFVGRLMRNKGIYYFLQAAQRITQQHRSVRFLVAGDSDYGSQAMLTQEDLNWYRRRLASAVDFAGHLLDIRPILSKSSVLVLPSYYREGVPQSILEAMAFSLPIITTDRPGCRETVQHGMNGYLVSPHNVDQLVECMERFIANPHLVAQMGAQSRALVVERFSEQSVIDATFCCYQRFLNTEIVTK